MMDAGREMNSSLHIVQHPNAIAKDADLIACDSTFRKVSGQPRLRRSWYSMTFDDDECDSMDECRWTTADLRHDSSLDQGAASVATTAPEANCNADANSDASTDVGSDDDCGAKCSDDFEIEEARATINPSRQADAREDSRQLLCDPSLSDEAVCDDNVNTADLAAMQERRLQKRLRQRQQRKEHRTQERAERSAMRKPSH
jgi:hypothetical protein